MTHYTLANTDIVNIRAQSFDIKSAEKSRLVLPFLLSIILAGLGALYVFAINGAVGGTYEIRALNQKLQDLRGQNQLIEIEAAQGRALPDLRTLTAPLNLVAIEKIDYINVSGTDSLALNR
ncbi:MAG: hypothetical protein Q8L57_00340 [bacterium]|nr:hypothetical protein [bacterium]